MRSRNSLLERGAQRGAAAEHDRQRRQVVVLLRPAGRAAGRPNASPTISRKLIFSRSTVRQTSSGSRRRRIVLDHDRVAAVHRASNAIQCAAPCMNGGDGQAAHAAAAPAATVVEGLPIDARRGGRRGRRRRCRPGATARPWACRSCRRCRGCRGRRATTRRRVARRWRAASASSYSDRAGQQRGAAAVVDLQQHRELGQVGEHRGEGRRERAAVDDRPRRRRR